KRLHDAALEAELQSGEIVPVIASGGGSAPPHTATKRAPLHNRVAGILLHRALERWPCNLETLAAEAGASSEVVELVRKRLAVVAKSATMQRIARAQTLGRELPLRIGDRTL